MAWPSRRQASLRGSSSRSSKRSRLSPSRAHPLWCRLPGLQPPWSPQPPEIPAKRLQGEWTECMALKSWYEPQTLRHMLCWPDFSHLGCTWSLHTLLSTAIAVRLSSADRRHQWSRLYWDVTSSCQLSSARARLQGPDPMLSSWLAVDASALLQPCVPAAAPAKQLQSSLVSQTNQKKKPKKTKPSQKHDLWALFETAFVL